MSNLHQKHSRAKRLPCELSIGSWNVRGLTATSKRQTLGTDCKNYKIDLLCIQETKVKDHWEQTLHTGHKLILLQQKETSYRGLGFVIGPRLADHIICYKNISDRIATIDFSIPTRNEKKINCRMVNAYGPTSERAEEDPSLRDMFYAELASAITTPARWLTFICGDFNSKLGKLTHEDINAGLQLCMGSYGVGSRNLNGEALIDFLTTHGFFISNTAFQHPCRHRTTWTGYIKDHSKANNTRPVYNQIDYVLCQQKATSLLRDSRSYGGADLNTDHKLVITKLSMNNIHLVHKHRAKSTVPARINVEQLCRNNFTKQKYREQLGSMLSEQMQSNDLNKDLNCLLNCMRTSALETAGERKTGGANRLQNTNDTLVMELSKQQKILRLRIHQHSKSEDRTDLRKERNGILRQISKRLKEIAIEKADSLAEEITTTDESRKMFRAAKELKALKRTPPITVHNTEGNFVGTDKCKAETIREWFQNQFTDHQDEPLQPFTGEPRALCKPVEQHEVRSAISALQNGRATGPDNINSELFKNASDIVSDLIAKIINQSFEQHKPIETLGEGTLIALAKPKKAPGPPSNLRPIILLNSIRKILSTITLRRIRDKVDSFTGPYQSGFKRGRSCADIVWAQRMLISVVMTKKWDFHKMGIDMSKAFDTIKRAKIIDILHEAECNEDELRMVRTLLSGTTLRVRVNTELSGEFETSIGSPQGDSLSPVLFTCYLASALKSVRAQSTRPDPPVSESGMPLEMEYADDVDFTDEERSPLDTLQSIAAEKLKDHNLFMNESKTEFTHVYLAEKTETGEDGQNVRGNEEWRKSRTLGSLLCSASDITARCNLGNFAFQTLWKIWIRRSRIPLKTRLRLYNAFCIPIMVYNSNSWSATKASLNKLDACHRKHLRRIAGHSWPDSLISNEALYKKCNCGPLSHTITRQRWAMFGHILRMDPHSPAQTALQFAVVGCNKYQTRRGRHCANLLEQLRADLKQVGLGPLRTAAHLNKLRCFAKDRAKWRAK